jgi:hypothetical protein
MSEKYCAIVEKGDMAIVGCHSIVLREYSTKVQQSFTDYFECTKDIRISLTDHHL